MIGQNIKVDVLLLLFAFAFGFLLKTMKALENAVNWSLDFVIMKSTKILKQSTSRDGWYALGCFVIDSVVAVK